MKESKHKRIHKEHRNSWINSFEYFYSLYILCIIQYIQPSSSSLIFKFYNAAYAFNSSSSLAGPSFWITISTPLIASTYYNTSSGYPPGISKLIGGLILLLLYYYQNLLKFGAFPPYYSSNWLAGILSCNFVYSYGFNICTFSIVSASATANNYLIRTWHHFPWKTQRTWWVK